MTAERRHTAWAWIVPGGAALLALGVIGYRLTQSADPAEIHETQSAPAGDRLATLEKRTREAPEDVAAWQALGWAHFEAGDYTPAAQAYRKAIALSPANAVLHASLGEALVMGSDHDPMPAEALAAFRKAAALDPKDPRARYFLAVARDLEGDHEGAIGDWLALLSDTPTGAPWEEDLKRTIQQVGKINKIETAARIAAIQQPAASDAGSTTPLAAQPIPGPSSEQMRAAAAMTPTQQRAMADEMVDKLEARLKSDPANVDGWVMLMRSRVTLEQRQAARTALTAALKANPDKEAYLRQQASVLGID